MRGRYASRDAPFISCGWSDCTRPEKAQPCRSRMRRLSILIFCFIGTIPCHAQSFRSAYHEGRSGHRIWHYIKTHKELLASDAIEISAWSADAASTVYDENHCPNCVEQNSIIGKRPSGQAVWAYAIGAASVHATLSHLAWHYSPDSDDRHLIWFTTGILAVTEAFNVYGNTLAPQGASSAVARGSADDLFRHWARSSSALRIIPRQSFHAEAVASPLH